MASAPEPGTSITLAADIKPSFLALPEQPDLVLPALLCHKEPAQGAQNCVPLWHQRAGVVAPQISSKWTSLLHYIKDNHLIFKFCQHLTLDSVRLGWSDTDIVPTLYYSHQPTLKLDLLSFKLYVKEGEAKLQVDLVCGIAGQLLSHLL